MNTSDPVHAVRDSEAIRQDLTSGWSKHSPWREKSQRLFSCSSRKDLLCSVHFCVSGERQCQEAAGLVLGIRGESPALPWCSHILARNIWTGNSLKLFCSHSSDISDSALRTFSLKSVLLVT